jgi:glycosidase
MKHKNIIFFLLIALNSFAQDFNIKRVEPPNWWVGMKYDTVQIMVYGKNLKDVDIYPQHGPIEITSVHKAISPDYLFIDVFIPSEVKSNYNFEIGFSNGSQDTVIKYPIFLRENTKDKFNGFNQSDIIYLIMADRFCDGNPSNNNIGDSLDQFTSKDLDGRKGGDIEGIISKLDYLKDLGVSSLWITPMLENNMWMSYHGYAATDLYKIDPRFGSNELYKKLVEQAHEKGLKIIMDHVSNHIGINHWWMKDLPFSDWINGTVKNHLPANNNKMTFLDTHSPKQSVDLIWKGWFTDYMPDLNQANPYLKKYLIQNTIWWTEYLGLDGIREDTYPYCNQYYLSEWNKEILNEYPTLNIVGEIWTGETPFLAGYQRDSKLDLKFNSNLPTVTDFAFSDALRDFLSDKKGFEGIFNTIAMDYIYSNPNDLLTFFDNHDISRGLYLAKSDIEKLKVALTILLTTRGIPMIFYGTEIGIMGDENHGNIRSPFPGGFEGDEHNAFTKCGRTTSENDIFNYTKQILQLRKTYKSLSDGKLWHYYPFDKLYVYFRVLDDESTMVIANGNEEEKVVELKNYSQILDGASSLLNLEDDDSISISENDTITIPKMSAKIFLVEKNK